MNMTLKQQLIKLKDHGKSKKERMRAEAILLFEKGYKKVKIADILGVSKRSIFQWFEEYRRDGLSSLSTKKGQGRKNLIDESKHREIVKNNIKRYPNQPKKAYSLTMEEIGVNMSYDTFKRFLKKHSI